MHVTKGMEEKYNSKYNSQVDDQSDNFNNIPNVSYRIPANPGS